MKVLKQGMSCGAITFYAYLMLSGSKLEVNSTGLAFTVVESSSRIVEIDFFYKAFALGVSFPLPLVAVVIDSLAR